SALTKAGNGRVDDAGIDGLYMGATESELLQRARAVGFDKDVGLRRKLEQNFYRFRPLEIEHEAALVAVERDEADAFAIADWRRRPALITSAPMSAASVPPSGPAMKLASSITLMPASGFAIDVSLPARICE